MSSKMGSFFDRAVKAVINLKDRIDNNPKVESAMDKLFGKLQQIDKEYQNPYSKGGPNGEGESDGEDGRDPQAVLIG